jgi:hypothetical protein
VGIILRHDSYYKKRWYDGEHVFSCSCGDKVIDYLFDDEINNEYLEGIAQQSGSYYADFINRTSFRYAVDFYLWQKTPICRSCSGQLSWVGHSGPTLTESSVAGSLYLLVQSNRYMAACVIFSSITEYQLNSLLFASLVDNGYDYEKAIEYADGKLSNGEIIRLLRIILSTNLSTMVLPFRNEIVHGREFGNDEEYFKGKLKRMIGQVKQWVEKFEYKPKDYNPTEIDRWFLYMNHWIKWCEKKI